jgi:hypothetical protein
MRSRIQRLFAEYGVAALVLHYLIFALVFAGAWVALRAGWRPRSFTGSAGLATVAYGITKLTMPLRLAATAALVPFVARGWERVSGRRRAADVPLPASDEPAAR